MENMIEDYTAACNSHDLERILSFFTDDIVYEDLGIGKVWRGKKELRDLFNSFFANLPDAKIELKSSFISGDWAADEWVISGTPVDSSPFRMQGSGKGFSVPGASIIELRNGKIKRNTDYSILSKS